MTAQGRRAPSIAPATCNIARDPMYPWLADAIERDATIITASRRLARELRAAFAAKQLEAGRESWVTPPIHSWNDWCRRQLENVADPHPMPVAIGDHCSAVLWEQCLENHAPDGLPAFDGFLRQAREAWQKARAWNVPVSALTTSARSPDEQLFANAASDYEAQLDFRRLTDTSGLPQIVARLLSHSVAGAPREVVFAGFDRVAPAVMEVIDALRTAGCKVDEPPDPETGAQVRVASFEDPDAEIRAAGAWARDILLHDPEARIAIIDPALESDAARKARLVLEGVAPGWQYAHASYRDAVDVSYGRKLEEYPAVAAALLIVKWLTRGLSTKEVSLLLRTRCVAGEESAGRSRLELALRRLPDRSWRAGDLRRVLHGADDGADSLAWLRGLDAVAALQEEGSRQASPAYWADRIDKLLRAWSWPGTATLSSGEFQLVARWRDLLNEFAGTAIVTPRLGLDEAVARVSSFAEDVVFQPETEGGLVSLMGTLEAAGMQFDHLWVTGMHAGLWPPAGNPSPLMSRDLQKAYGLPDATPADTLRFSRRVLQRLENAAPAVVLSWPASDGESELAASGFLDAVPHEAYEGYRDPGWHGALLCGRESTLFIADDPAPAVSADEIVRRGAYTVQQQCVEPFAAFVYGRLGVQRPDPIESGLAPRVRGEIIHKALHNLFADRPSRADIKCWDQKQLRERLGSAIDAALAAPLRHANETHARLLSLERKRLTRLLESFVDAELVRPEFSVVDVEKSLDFEAYGVRLELRIDRIDRLADGSILVIDYKTGAPRNLLDREGDPVDLQLVVYADALEEPVGGIAIINIDSRSVSYKGTGGSVEWDAARRDTWPERLAAWRGEVHEALREIAAGDVRINLKSGADESRPLAILSRIEELKRAH